MKIALVRPVRINFAGVAQLVEQQPSKLLVESSNLFARFLWNAGVAQLAEHVLGKDEVGGSSPLPSSNSAAKGAQAL